MNNTTNNNTYENRISLTVKEAVKYTGIGETNLRKIVLNPANKMSFRIGTKVFIVKDRLDSFLFSCANDNSDLLLI